MDLPATGVALRAGITVARRAPRSKGFAMPRAQGLLSGEPRPERTA
ncbi:hypothetical protein [Streptomyces sp. cmx-18-6]